MREEERTERRDDLADLVHERSFREAVTRQAARKAEARRRHGSIWAWLGTFGMVGWSVAIPALLGVALGVWVDHRWDTRFSFTLVFLVVGVAVGAVTAWYWVRRESSRSD